ncbi:hypothetical protein BN1723_018283, partial [Verticillium longisporum]
DGNKATYPFHLKPGASHSLRPPAARSSSTGDYRSVIDDLTVEIQKLKDELKKYKQSGPDLLKRDKLFEIKVHDMTSGDEEGGEPDNGDEPRPTHAGPDGPGLMLHQAPVRRSSSSAIAAAGTARGRSKSTDLPDSADSSNATVDAESGYKSSSECS